MSITHKTTIGVASDKGSSASGYSNETGGAVPGTPVTITVAGGLANTNVALTTSDGGAGLTGGSTPTVSVATTTAGLPSDTITLVAGIPYNWRKSAGYVACIFTVDVTSA